MKVEVLTVKSASLVLMLLPCLSIVALGQTSGVGSIVGSIKDSTGAVIPGVAVSLANTGTVGGNQQVITDETGGYRFIKLIPGQYGVRAELSGFRTTVHDSIIVDADATARVDLTLEVGTVSDTVNVTSEAVLVDTTTSLHQAVMDKSSIDALPLREDMWNIAKVVPGLILSQYDTAGDKAYTQSTITVHGANQTAEGAFTMDGFEFGSALNGGGDLAMYVPPQNYQEINYQGGNATAENQRGGVVYNFVTRTGTNEFHGDFSFSGTQASLQSNNISATDRANFLASLPASVVAANPNYNPSGKINGLYDADLAVTGPIIKNRVWFSATGFLGQLNSQQVGIALESVCYQTFDLWAAMRADWPDAKAANIVLRVDGGMTASDWTMQRLADLLDAPVDRPMIQETTALGAAYLAGLQAGIFPEPGKFADNWRLERRFKPAMSAATRERKLAGWARAVKGALASDEGEG